NKDRKATCLYPLLGSVDPHWMQHRKRSPIFDASARTISTWMAAVSRFPSTSDRPRVSRSAHASLSIRPTSISVVDPAPKSASSFNLHTNFCIAPPPAKYRELSRKDSCPPRLCMLSLPNGQSLEWWQYERENFHGRGVSALSPSTLVVAPVMKLANMSRI